MGITVVTDIRQNMTSLKNHPKKVQSRHELFAREYVIDLNGTRAALAAGYKKSTASEQATRLLNKPSMRNRVDELLAKRASKLEIKADRVLEELGRIGFANMADYIRTSEQGDAYVHLADLTPDKAAAIQEITVEEYTDGRGENARDIKRTKFKLADKISSLELLGKHLSLFSERVEHSGTVEFQIAPIREQLMARLSGEDMIEVVTFPQLTEGEGLEKSDSVAKDAVIQEETAISRTLVEP